MGGDVNDAFQLFIFLGQFDHQAVTLGFGPLAFADVDDGADQSAGRAAGSVVGCFAEDDVME